MDLDQLTESIVTDSASNANITATSTLKLKSTYDIDIIRLIGQYLTTTGLKKTANLLLEESGLHQLDHPTPLKLRDHILAGEWDKANGLIEEVANLAMLWTSSNYCNNRATDRVSNGVLDGCNPGLPTTTTKSSPMHDLEKRRNLNIIKMRLAIAEQKFLELLDDDDRIKALRCMRCEITPLCEDVKRIHFLANLLMCKSTAEIRLRANWQGKNQQTRQLLFDKISRAIPPPILLPPKRLETLLDQAINFQKDRSVLPNCVSTIISDQDHIGCNGICCQQIKTSNILGNHQEDSDHRRTGGGDLVDLKSDQSCVADKFPLITKQTLYNHNSEVWFCQWSNDGTRLATGGFNGKIIIWTLDPETKDLTEKCKLDCPSHSISCLSWSPDDIYLLACGFDEKHLWIWNTETEQIQATINHKDEDGTTTCSWHPSGRRFAAASIKGTFNIYDINGNKCGNREGVRVQCLSFLHNDPNLLLAADTLHRIKGYKVDCNSIPNLSITSDEEDVLEERFPISSFVIDKEDKYVAVNIKNQGVNLWDLQCKTLLKIFLGVLQRDLTIYSSFSSQDATFLASGSEDGKIYIYHLSRDQPIAILNGHRRCVNCVSWNTKFPELLASVSDDHSVRLWTPVDPTGHQLYLCRSLSQVIQFCYPSEKINLVP